MKRLIAVLVLVVGLGAPAEGQTRTFLYQGCGEWGCASLQFTGTLAFGARWWNTSFDSFTSPDDYVWLYRGIWGVVEEPPAGLMMRTSQWGFVGDPNSYHLFSDTESDDYWVGSIGGGAYFEPDFIAPSAFAGRMETCAIPTTHICLGGYTNWGGASLQLVSVTTTPEPATLWLVWTGLAVMIGFGRRRTHN